MRTISRQCYIYARERENRTSCCYFVTSGTQFFYFLSATTLHLVVLGGIDFNIPSCVPYKYSSHTSAIYLRAHNAAIYHHHPVTGDGRPPSRYMPLHLYTVDRVFYFFDISFSLPCSSRISIHTNNMGRCGTTTPVSLSLSPTVNYSGLELLIRSDFIISGVYDEDDRYTYLLYDARGAGVSAIGGLQIGSPMFLITTWHRCWLRLAL